MDNLLEYALGGNPTNDDAAAFMPTTPGIMESGGTNYLVYTYRRRTDDGERKLDYNVNVKYNLITDPWAEIGDLFEEGSGPINSQFELVTNNIPTVYSDEAFIQLKVTEWNN